MTIIGTGAEARSHLLIIPFVRDIKECRIVSRNHENVIKFVEGIKLFNELWVIC
jgi:ornithine cyclodeaminase/alanine dehydrogenase-like protein (mu-crystallin family)